ncbi:hypothetical protein Bestia_00054 [Acinetobacter phage Bestia]|nr:hypothetical protein Bestia_00054 [Acinetobacter phage Bestia]
MILEWLKAHVGVIFMGVAGVILCAALSTPMVLYYFSRPFDKLTFCDKMNSF